jgi:hypothetical protein
MKPNVGMLDRGLRLASTFVIFYLYYTGIVNGTVAIVLIVLGGIFFLTSLMGYCPLYGLFGLSTRKKTPKQ